MRKGTVHGSEIETISHTTGATGMSPTKGGLQDYLTPMDWSAVVPPAKKPGQKGDAKQNRDLAKLGRGGAAAPSETQSKAAKSMFSKKSGGPGT